MRQDCLRIIETLNNTKGAQWAVEFVEFKMWFHRKYCLGLIFSTIHGCDFFDNVIRCLDGKTWEPDNKGEYEENFRKFIKHYEAK